MGFGKIFASTFTGSMVGAGLEVIGVWAYVLANTKPPGEVELNPALVAVALGCEPAAVERALETLCAPDPRSRSKEHEGRRLLPNGEFLYRVTNWDKYHTMRNEEERREYFRNKKRESRARGGGKKAGVKPDVQLGQTLSNDVQRCPPVSTHADTDTDTDTEKTVVSPTRRVTDAFVESYRRRFKSEYQFDGAKDGKLVKRLLEKAGGDAEQVVARLRFAEQDEFHSDKLRDFGYFFAAWNKLVPTHAPLLAVNGSNGRWASEGMWRERLKSPDPEMVALARKNLAEHGVTV